MALPSRFIHGCTGVTATCWTTTGFVATAVPPTPVDEPPFSLRFRFVNLLGFAGTTTWAGAITDEEIMTVPINSRNRASDFIVPCYRFLIRRSR